MPAAVAAPLYLALLAGQAAGAAFPSVIYEGATSQMVDLERALEGVRAGQVIVVGEQHDLAQHHAHELAVLRALGNMDFKVSLGLEVLQYPDQPWVDRYVRGVILEPEFLRAIHWAGYPFEWLRPLIQFSWGTGGEVRALNAPKRLAAALAQRGPAGLSREERSWLPPDFRLGNFRYFERVAQALRQHGPLTARQTRNFFAAQSAWDDTMAWQAREFMTAHPDQVLVILAGDMHVSYGGGLPDRLRARGATDVLVISQVDGKGLSDGEIRRLVARDPRYGVRADYVWVTGGLTRRPPGRLHAVF